MKFLGHHPYRQRRGDGPEDGMGTGHADAGQHQHAKALGCGGKGLAEGKDQKGPQQKPPEIRPGGQKHQRQGHQHDDEGVDGDQKSGRGLGALKGGGNVRQKPDGHKF